MLSGRGKIEFAGRVTVLYAVRGADGIRQPFLHPEQSWVRHGRRGRRLGGYATRPSVTQASTRAGKPSASRHSRTRWDCRPPRTSAA